MTMRPGATDGRNNLGARTVLTPGAYGRTRPVTVSVCILLSATKERTDTMQKRAIRSMVGPLIALTLAAMPAISFAQKHKNDKSTTSTTTTTTTTTTYRSDMPNEFTAGPAAGRVQVMQTILDKGFTHHDLVVILPLLQDLRDARRMCDAKMDDIYADLALSRGSHANMAGDTRVADCERTLSDRQRAIWNTISDRVGADKANALRRLVEPVTEDVSRVAYTDVYIQRIDTMLQDLDRMAAARIAANGGTPPPADQTGVQAASVETRTTTTTVAPTPIYVTTPATINERELVHVVQDRIVAEEIGNSDYAMFMPMHGDLTSADLTFLREGAMKVWY